VKPAPFAYHRPRARAEALELLDRHAGEAKVLAGGQSLVPLMNFRLARPGRLVDLGSIDDLAYVREADGTLRIGAMTRQADIEDSPALAARCPLLVQATRWIGHRTIRNRGTIGGSLAHADPSAEYPAVLVALDGEVVASGAGRERVVPARDLFVSYCMTSLAPTELITEVRVPATPPRTGTAFVELSRRHGDFAIVGVAASVGVGGDGALHDARIALAGVGSAPIRCTAAERALEGERPEAPVLAHAATLCARASDPGDDLHATADYRRAMVEVFVRRALAGALSRTGGP
jgi:carbon-monoxide dehydrogenase medium subunit